MRFPAFATSLAVHAAVLATVLLVPILGDGPLPTTTLPELPLHPWPMTPRVAFADSRPAAVPLRRAAARRTTEVAVALPTAPTSPSPEIPDPDISTDPMVGEDTLLDAAVPGARCCGTGAGSGSGDPEGGSLGTGPGPGSGTGAVRVGGLVVPPTKIHHVDPVYPEIARAATRRRT